MLHLHQQLSIGCKLSDVYFSNDGPVCMRGLVRNQESGLKEEIAMNVRSMHLMWLRALQRLNLKKYSPVLHASLVLDIGILAT